MAMFVHLTSETNVNSIEKTGIKVAETGKKIQKGVFAMAVTPNFVISHQWLRELKSQGQKTIVGIYFRIPDDEIVYIAHYSKDYQEVKASEAVDIILKNINAEGYEILIPRKIEKKEIHKIRHLPQVIGWRYQPGSHEKPYCGCPVCVRPGSVNSKKKNLAWEEKQ